MKQGSYLRIAHWLLTAALLVSVYCVGHGALLVYALSSSGEATVFEPAQAEEVSRRAAPFQANTRETDGMFRLVQQQHMDLHLKFSRLDTAVRLNWQLAVLWTLTFSGVSLLLAGALGMLHLGNTGLTHRSSGPPPPAAER